MSVSAESGRKPYVDGLRGVAALVVLFGHLLITLLPPIVYLGGGVGAALYLIALGKTPLGVLWNGNAAVCVFFILSGYVLADFGRHTQLSFPAQALRRYLRLALPILFASSFAYLLLRFGLMRNAHTEDFTSGWIASWYLFAPSGRTMLYEALIGTFVDGSHAYNPNLWTMHPELLGSLYVLAINAVGRWRQLRVALYGVLMIYYRADYLPLFAIGALLYEFENELGAYFARLNSALRSGLLIGLFAAGAYACSLPQAPPGMALPWHFILLPIFPFENERYWHSVGAIMIVTAVLHSPSLQTMFASRIGRFLGRISFTLYLIHIPILCSFTAWLALAVQSGGRQAALLACGPSTIAIVLIASWILSDPIDGGAIRLSRAAGLLWMRLFAGREPKAAVPVPVVLEV